MPPLSQTLRRESPKGYAAMEELPASTPSPQREPGVAMRGNAFIRCPLPPFNATTDTLRQFNESGKVPARRVIPLPPQVGQAGALTVVNNTSVSQSGGSSSSGNVVTLPVKTVTIDAPTLLAGESTVVSVTANKIAVLISVGASDLCEIRIYGDPLSQSSDLPRLTDSAVPFETLGVVTDVVLDTDPLQFNWQNRLFVNQDSPQTDTFYVTILNPTDSAVTPSVTITYLPLE